MTRIFTVTKRQKHKCASSDERNKMWNASRVHYSVTKGNEDLYTTYVSQGHCAVRNNLDVKGQVFYGKTHEVLRIGIFIRQKID